VSYPKKYGNFRNMESPNPLSKMLFFDQSINHSSSVHIPPPPTFPTSHPHPYILSFHTSPNHIYFDFHSIFSKFSYSATRFQKHERMLHYMKKEKLIIVLFNLRPPYLKTRGNKSLKKNEGMARYLSVLNFQSHYRPQHLTR